MSGGSWNYLYCKDVDELMNGLSTELLQDMADRLNSAGFEDVAKDTQRLVEYIKSASIRIETLFEALSPVFKAVEWFDSGDWGKEALNNEVLKYRKSNIDSYDKAVDDLTANIIERFSGMAMSSGLPTEGATWENAIRQVKQIAEQLKGAKQSEDFKQEEIQQTH